MIFEALISVVLQVLGIIIGLLPNHDVDTLNWITSQLALFRTNLTGVDWIFPVNTFLLVLGVVLSIESTTLVFKLAKWVATNISGGIFKGNG